MLPKIILRFSIVALCFVISSASADWLPSNAGNTMFSWVIFSLIPVSVKLPASYKKKII